MLSNPLKYLQKPFTLKPMSDTEWKAVYKAIPDDDGYDKAINELFSGILPIGSMGCTGVMGLILNGENKGKVMYLDQGLSKPILSDLLSNFCVKSYCPSLSYPSVLLQSLFQYYKLTTFIYPTNLKI